MTHPRGRRPIGILQGAGQGGDDYPLVAPSPEIERLLADAFIAFVDNINRFRLPFRIKWLYGFGTNPVAVPITPLNSHDIQIVDANGTVVFDSLDGGSFEEWTWDDRLRILEWAQDQDVVRIVYHYEWSPEDTQIVYDDYIEPTDALLDNRTTWQYPRRVNTLKVGLSSVQQPTVRFQNGYNIDLVTGVTNLTDGERRSTNITFNATPGGGSVGRFGPGCDDTVDPAIRRINDIGPAARGNFTLDASGCYRVQRPILDVLSASGLRDIRVQNHALQVTNDCGPCCECQDFFNVWEAIRRLTARYTALTVAAQTVRDQYHRNRERWLAAEQCRLSDRLRVVIQPVCPDELGVAVGYCNNSDECLENLVIPISFQYVDNSPTPCTNKDVTCEDGPTANDPLTAVTTAPFGDITCQSTFRSGNTDPDQKKGCEGGPRPIPNEFYKLGGEFPHFWAQWDLVEPGGMASVTFRMRFDNPAPEDVVEIVADAYEVGGKGAIVGSGAPIPGYVPGEGPVSTPASMHLVDCPKKVSTGLTDEPCCESSVSNAE